MQLLAEQAKEKAKEQRPPAAAAAGATAATPAEPPANTPTNPPANLPEAQASPSQQAVAPVLLDPTTAWKLEKLELQVTLCTLHVNMHFQEYSILSF